MGNDKYIIPQATEAFRKKNYTLALSLWKQASTTLGEKNFRANIQLAEKLSNNFKLQSQQKNVPTWDNLPTISVIIPTYKNNEYIKQCINSVLHQDYPSSKIQIIISVNGSNIDYFISLLNEYSSRSNIHVIYTHLKGASAARNFALQYATGEYLAYLDDDDYFTPGYIREMACHSAEDIDIICGRLIDYHQDSNTFNSDTYVNRILENREAEISTNILKNASLFSTICLKLYKKKFILSCTALDEDLAHTEDVDFWVNNFQNISGKLYLCNPMSEEAYVRRVTSLSVSRPSEDNRFSFYITDRLKLIERFSRKVFSHLSLAHKRFILGKIDAQTKHMLNFFEKLSKNEQYRAVEMINRSNAAFLNKSKFGLVKGIAFCHNFSPYADASAYVAAKRLSQISAFYGQNIYWHVFCALMHTRQRDDNFEMFFARYQYAEKHIVGEKAYFNEKAQWEWGQKAFEAASSFKADVIYSRSMWAGSHVAAYLYKQKYPDVKWYAEFSDPIYMGTDNKERKYAKHYDDQLSFLNTFWKDIEFNVIDNADIVIFTNKNQKKYMLLENTLLKDATSIEEKSMCIGHPSLPSCYCKLNETNYQLDCSAINIGYFGSFYANRHINDFFAFLKQSNTYLHVFTSSENPTIPSEFAQYEDRIRINKQVQYFDFLNLASKMDYLYLNDINFPHDINPYLPSKITDYLITGTPVLAKIFPGSPLSEIKHPKLIFIQDNRDCLNIKLEKNVQMN